MNGMSEQSCADKSCAYRWGYVLRNLPVCKFILVLTLECTFTNLDGAACYCMCSVFVGLAAYGPIGLLH